MTIEDDNQTRQRGVMTREEAAETYIEENLVFDDNNIAYKAFLAGVKWANKNPQWISVEERLPEKDQRVLVFHDVWDYMFAEFKISEETEEGVYNHWLDEYGDEIDTVGVTHWLPLPKGPSDD